MNWLRRMLPAIERLTPGVRWRGRSDERICALTFDDGPDEAVTIPLLDLLDVYEVPAAFFCTGRNAEAHPELVRAIGKRGHTVGIHGWTHRSFFTLGPEAIRWELVRSARLVEDLIGIAPRFARPPFGHVSPSTLSVVRDGMFEFLVCDVLPKDWDATQPVESIIRRTVAWTHPGSIIGLHDGGNPRVLEIVPRVVEKLRRKGFVFVGLESILSVRGQ